MIPMVVAVLLLCIGCSAAPEGNPAAELETLMKKVEQFTPVQVAGRLRLVPEFESFAKTYRYSDEALAALLWLLEQSSQQFSRSQVVDGYRRNLEKERRQYVRKLINRLLHDYLDSSQLSRIPEMYYIFEPDECERYFNRLLEESPNLEVQAAALFGLARNEQNSEENGATERFQMYLDRILSDYFDVPWNDSTYGILATAWLDPPAVGKPAPDIIGVTHTGEELRLSDYFGRVIVLDFWGGLVTTLPGYVPTRAVARGPTKECSIHSDRC